MHLFIFVDNVSKMHVIRTSFEMHAIQTLLIIHLFCFVCFRLYPSIIQNYTSRYARIKAFLSFHHHPGPQRLPSFSCNLHGIQWNFCSKFTCKLDFFLRAVLVVSRERGMEIHPLPSFFLLFCRPLLIIPSVHPLLGGRRPLKDWMPSLIFRGALTWIKKFTLSFRSILYIYFLLNLFFFLLES